MISKIILIVSLSAGATLLSCAASSDVSTNLENEVQLLREQNRLLQQQLEKQGGDLDALAKKVQALEAAKTADENGGAGAGDTRPAGTGFNFGKVSLGAEGGVGVFDTGPHGFSPQTELRVDEARLFVEAPIWNEVYFASDVDLATRENTTTDVTLGELYLDFEDASQLWGKDSQLNVRVGQMQIPFGEEYIYRYAMENPLISHSLTDFWGIDPGLELYGSLGKFSYATAVQNGSGTTGDQDFDGDKAVAGRIGFDPDQHWHFSVSGMRTGALDAQQHMLSAIWFGNGFFKSIGSPATASFHADAVEGDATARWKSGHVSAFGGYVRYNDDNPAADDARNIFYYALEVEQDLPHKFYVATRFSEIYADQGYPILGFGNYNDYHSVLTTELWRLSLGAGYRFSDRLALKTEYSLERGDEVGGVSRGDEDFLGTEAVFKF